MTASPKQVSLFVVKWKPKAGQPIPWEIKQKLCKPKGGRNKKGDFDNFHNRDYDFVSPSGEIFTGKGVRQFALLHGLHETCLYAVLDGRVHSHKGWTKVVGGRKLPVPPTYYFLSPSGEIHTTTNLSEFARQHGLCASALSRISRCLKATHKGWRHCTPDGQPIVPPDIKHRKFTLLSPAGEIIKGSNLKAFAEQNSLSRGCLMNVLDGTSKEHKGWRLPVISTTTPTTAPNLGKFFTSCTKRPATAEDIKILSPGDWVSEIDCPWAWQFKNSCQDMTIGVWEGKEFFVPHHLLMVCEIIEGQVVEKFFKKSEPKFKVGEPWDLPQEWSSVGVRCSYENDLIIWGDKHFRIQPKIKEKYLNPRLLVDFLRDNWHVLQCLCKHLVKSSQPATEKEIIAHFGCKANYAKSAIRLGVNSGILAKLKGGKYEISSQPLLEEIKAKTVEEAEKLFNNQELCSHQDTSIVEAAVIQKAQLPQDTSHSGQSKATPTLQASTESDSQESCSSNKMSEPLQMSLLPDSQYQMSQFGVHLVQTFPWLVSELDLLEFADNCFLKDSDFFDSNAQVHLSLKMLTDSLAQTKQLPSRKSSKRLQIWGIAAPGNLGMATGTSPKTENGFSSWAITAEVSATQPKPTKKTLQEVFETQAIPVKVYVDGVAEATESPTFCSGGWQHRSPVHRDKRGASFAVLYRAAGGDRIYTEVAPTLRSLSNTGNHQSGSGAYKIREYEGETYLERPINATEAEQLMGWEVGSTAIGINKEGDEISISQTQRIKMIGNGIIPGEITDILTAIKPILERKLESEVPENMRFAYRQLQQRGMGHKEAIKRLSD